MSIEVNVTGNPIQASVTESGASVSVSPLSVAASVAAGIGPQGPTGPTGPTGPVASVNGFTGAVVLTSASVSAASAVHTHTTGQITGLDSHIAEQATNAAVVRTLNGITGTLTIAAGDNVTVSTAGSTLTIAAGGGGGDAPMPTLTITGGSISPLILELIQQVT